MKCCVKYGSILWIDLEGFVEAIFCKRNSAESRRFSSGIVRFPLAGNAVSAEIVKFLLI